MAIAGRKSMQLGGVVPTAITTLRRLKQGSRRYLRGRVISPIQLRLLRELAKRTMEPLAQVLGSGFQIKAPQINNPEF